MRPLATAARKRLFDVVLVGAVIVGSVWLGSLLYHNRLGGHVERPTVTWRGEISSAGGVITVVNEAGSVWGGTATLIEEASIGVEAGSDAYMLGEVRGIAATDERIYVVDAALPAVRVYDSDGHHLMDVGSRGQGPGEFLSPRSVAVAPDGRLYVYADRRISVYSADGDCVEVWPYATGLDSATPMVLALDGTLYVDDLVGGKHEVSAWQHGMIAAGSRGAMGEPIEVPAMEYERDGLMTRFPGGAVANLPVPFNPRLVWVMTPSRTMIAGVPSEYRFEIHAAEGPVRVVHKHWTPVPVTPREAAWNREWISAARHQDDPEWTWNGPPIPDRKPAYDSFYAAPGGRIWVARILATEEVEDCGDRARHAGAARGCWRQRYGYDVFDADGKFLGPVEVPGGDLLQPVVMRDEDVIGYTVGDDGVGRVKRYRLVLPVASRP